MKKILSFLAAVCILTGMSAALAETIPLGEAIPGYELSIDIPEEAHTEFFDDASNLMIRISAPGSANYTFTIAPSEEAEGKSMADLTEEERNTLVALVSDSAAQPEYSFLTLEANGLEVLFLEEQTEINDFAIMLTIFDGHFINLFAAHSDYATLSLKDLEMLATIMSTLVITQL